MQYCLKRERFREARRHGQALVEFALGVSFLMLCLIGVVYFGKAFYFRQTFIYTSEEGARAAARVPNLQDTATRDNFRGFTMGGTAVNPNSIIYQQLSASQLLSNGYTGNLPPLASVKILPWDADVSANDYVPPGTVGVEVTYPFSLLINPFTGQAGTPVTVVAIPTTIGTSAPLINFPDFSMSEKATAAAEVYQGG